MNDGERPNPDALLAAIQNDAAQAKRGRLKVFLGMCPGVGKTYAMLEAAQVRQREGGDVVVGIVETHGRTETYALLAGLTIIPRKESEHRGVALKEMNLDAILSRRPQLVLVDEFAHTNAPGSRHPKRWQDVEELLDAGIDVFTTINVQHIESRMDVVQSITGITVRETVPDSVFDQADEIELVDLTPDQLRKRLGEGKVYLGERAATAAENFFREGNLTALRELALRFVADHVGEDTQVFYRARTSAGPWKTNKRLLVAVSPSPTSASLLRWTRRLAGELHAPWLAVYVELPRALSNDDQTRLAKHLALARELGAQVVTTTDGDVVRGLLRVAREQNATQLVVGKPAGWRTLELLRGGSFLNRLIRESGGVDIHVVRADGGETTSRPLSLPRVEMSDARGFGVAAVVVAAVTGLNFFLQRWIGHEAAALIYLASVIVLGIFVGRGPTLMAATFTALLWDFLFLPPRFTFYITSIQDALMFGMYFVVAIVLGQLTARIRAQQTAERRREERATALYLLTRELAKAPDLVELLAIVVREVGKTFNADVAISLPEESEPTPTPYFASTWTLDEKELSVAIWAFRNRQPAGRTTDTLPSAEGLHLPLVAGERAIGVLSLRLHDAAPPAPAQRDLLGAFIPQIALVLDRQRLRDEEREAELLAESERLGKTLLDSLSHEMRTPIAAIASAATNLAEAKQATPEFQRTMVGEIQEAAARLNRLVGNVLDMTRLESGHVQPKLDWCDVNDLLNATLRETKKELAQHKVAVTVAPDLPLVRVDFQLMQQALMNLLLNAALHTPPGTVVEVGAKVDGKTVVLTVADNGAGLPAEVIPRLFDKFYRAPAAPAGGTGLGLSIVKGFVEAHDGTITAANRAGGGAVFTIRLPLEELPAITAEGKV